MVSFFLGHSVYISIIYIVIVHRSTFTHSYLCVCLLSNFQLWKRLRNKLKGKKKRWDRQCLNPKKKNISKKEKHKTDIHKKKYLQGSVLWDSNTLLKIIRYRFRDHLCNSKICNFRDLQILRFANFEIKIPSSEIRFFFFLFRFSLCSGESDFTSLQSYSWMIININNFGWTFLQ